ncbi:malate permease [Capsulimonas corticalis]|uniref:Malate permease n=1 Tax=Capsulimonas corticalis TaxID=2219043 RepID=A0A402CUS7_9BACT|nr:AEC family transporter [Capsulimonas corticalis]BDI29085.1 malate permease [Capsulimonas corticalis]
MTVFAATLTALAPLFALILLGYALKRARVLHSAHAPVLNGLVVNATLPALVVHGLATAPAIPARAFCAPLAIFLTELALFALILTFGRILRLSRPRLGALLLVGTFGNTGFLGYPITLALLPHQFPTAILIDQFGMTVPLTIAAALIGSLYGSAQTQEGASAALLRLLRSPILPALALGLLAHFLPAAHAFLASPLGQILDKTLGYLAQGTTPLVLLAVGLALRPEAAGKNVLPLLLSCTLKLLISPLIMLPLSRLFGLRGDLLTISILLAAMPTSVMSSVYSAHHDMDGDYAVATVFVSTLLSALTIPWMLSLAR